MCAFKSLNLNKVSNLPQSLIEKLDGFLGLLISSAEQLEPTFDRVSLKQQHRGHLHCHDVACLVLMLSVTKREIFKGVLEYSVELTSLELGATFSILSM